MGVSIRGAGPTHVTLAAALPNTSVLLIDSELAVVSSEGEALTALPVLEQRLRAGERLTDELPGAMATHVRHALDGQRSDFDFEYHGVTLSAQAAPFKGTDYEAALVMRDVTGQMEAERRLAAHAEQQRAVARIGQLALGLRDLQALMEEVASTVARTLDVGLCRVMRTEPDGRQLRVVAGEGWRPGVVGTELVPYGEGEHADATTAAHGPLVFTDLASEKYRAAMLERHGVVSGMSVLVGRREHPFGILGAHSTVFRHFSPDDVNFLTAMANVLSAAIDRHQEEQSHRHAALHDPLTGLPNRTLTLTRLREALDSPDPIAVLVVDLDRFSMINDSLGHAAGDAVLVALAPRLLGVVGQAGTVARLSGDEFLVVYRPPAQGPSAAELAVALREAIGRPLELGGAQHVLTASVGISLSSGGDQTPETLMEQADAAMYRAKRRGRGGHEVFDERLRRLTVDRLELERGLQRALGDGQLHVAYQPIVDLPSLRPVALEALLRWDHPERGPIRPDEFIPVAEDAGLMGELGRWILNRAARDVAALQERFDPALMAWVNVSGREVGRSDFAAQAATIAQESGLTPGSLVLELTESVLMEEADGPDTVLGQLHDHGLHLALDDFGTGYSSLSYLKTLPLDALKIDRSFVAGVDANEDDRAIVEATVVMAHALGLAVVAEGVETTGQLDALRWMGCDRAQGYLFARPAPLAQTTEMLARSYRRARAGA